MKTVGELIKNENRWCVFPLSNTPRFDIKKDANINLCALSDKLKIGS